MVRLQLERISKFFPGVKALDQVDFELMAGEVHAVCGENGAGKSTLMNILTGNLQPDEGIIRLDGQSVTLRNPRHAGQLGIAIVYQQLSLTDNLSIAENVFASQPPRNRLGFLDYPQLYEKTADLLGQLQVASLSPRTRVADLSPGQKQLVEIAKALSAQPDILILDEPTASLTQPETRKLFSIIRRLKAEGKSVIYISHRMTEIFEIADRISVLKDGKYQGTQSVSALSPDSLIEKMVGRAVVFQKQPSRATPQVWLEVKNLSGQRFKNISFNIRKGEIVALAGLIGAGRSEIAQTLFGYLPALAGTILKNGKNLHLPDTAHAIASGIGYVPEERKTQGIFEGMSVTENIVSANLKAATKNGWYDTATATVEAEKACRQLRIVTPDTQQTVRHLSGGNQQKVVLAKWLLANPDLLIIDEPTHGVDVGVKAEIYDLLRQFVANGKSILLISSELPEVLALADRILVIRRGELTAELTDQTTEAEVLKYAM